MIVAVLPGPHDGRAAGCLNRNHAGPLGTDKSDRLELVIAQPTGFAEIYEGTIATIEGVIVMDVRSTSIGATSTAKEITITERTFELEGDELRYTFRMAAVGEALQHHLSATLRRARSE